VRSAEHQVVEAGVRMLVLDTLVVDGGLARRRADRCAVLAGIRRLTQTTLDLAAPIVRQAATELRPDQRMVKTAPRRSLVSRRCTWRQSRKDRDS
jgi:hypothetical protein